MANQAIVFQPQFGKFYYDNKSAAHWPIGSAGGGGK